MIHDSITVETVPEMEDAQDEEMAELEMAEEIEERKRMQDMIIVQTPPEYLAEGDSSASERTDQADIIEDDALQPPDEEEIEEVEMED